LIYRTKIAKLIKDKYGLSFKDGLNFADYYSSKDRSEESILANGFAIWDISYFDCNCCIENVEIICNDKVYNLCDMIVYINSFIEHKLNVIRASIASPKTVF